MPDGITDVAVGVLTTADDMVLLGSRPEGKPWAGWWEMPGGKLEPGETVQQALRRELREELGIEVTEDRAWVTYVHQYPTTTVRLHFRRVTAWDGQPKGLENQALKWVPIQTATQLPDLLPAAYPPLRWLNLPERYLISSAVSEEGLEAFMHRLRTALDSGIRLIQWREPQWQTGSEAESLPQALDRVVKMCRAHQAKVLVNSCHEQQLWSMADGVHLRASDAQSMQQRPQSLQDKLLGVSAHNVLDLSQARTLGADFAVLGPVLPTESHPGEATLGWDAFEELNEQAGLPVYAIGGQTPNTLLTAKSRGAHGIAGIRQLLG